MTNGDYPYLLRKVLNLGNKSFLLHFMAAHVGFIHNQQYAGSCRGRIHVFGGWLGLTTLVRRKHFKLIHAAILNFGAQLLQGSPAGDGERGSPARRVISSSCSYHKIVFVAALLCMLLLQVAQGSQPMQLQDEAELQWRARRGGRRQRAQASQALQSIVPASGRRFDSHLAAHLVQEWGWRHLSAPQVQKLAQLALQDQLSILTQANAALGFVSSSLQSPPLATTLATSTEI